MYVSSMEYLAIIVVPEPATGILATIASLLFARKRFVQSRRILCEPQNSRRAETNESENSNSIITAIIV